MAELFSYSEESVVKALATLVEQKRQERTELLAIQEAEFERVSAESHELEQSLQAVLQLKILREEARVSHMTGEVIRNVTLSHHLYEFRGSDRMEFLAQRYTESEKAKTDKQAQQQLKCLLNQIDGNIAMNYMFGGQGSSSTTGQTSSSTGRGFFFKAVERQSERVSQYAPRAKSKAEDKDARVRYSVNSVDMFVEKLRNVGLTK